MHRALRCSAWILVSLALLFPEAVPLCAEDVEPGIDLWKTPLDFNPTAQPTIPPGFFDPGSNPIIPTIRLRGDPIPTAPGSPSLGVSDTMLERQAPAPLPTCGAGPVTVPLIIRALNLRSIEPITVTYNNTPPELWDVQVCLSNAPQRPGTLTLRRTCERGGTFNSAFSVRPKFIFTRRSDGRRRILDPASQGNPTNNEVHFTGSGEWVYQSTLDVFEVPPGARPDGNCDGVFEGPFTRGTSNFAVGVRTEPCQCVLEGGQVYSPVMETAEETANNHPVVQEGYPCQVRHSFPLQDRDHPGKDGLSNRFTWRGFAAVAILALVAALIPLRRPPTGSSTEHTRSGHRASGSAGASGEPGPWDSR